MFLGFFKALLWPTGVHQPVCRSEEDSIRKALHVDEKERQESRIRIQSRVLAAISEESSLKKEDK